MALILVLRLYKENGVDLLIDQLLTQKAFYFFIAKKAEEVKGCCTTIGENFVS